MMKLVVWLYSAFIRCVVVPVVKALQPFSRHWRTQLAGRYLADSELAELQVARSEADHSYFFFCSSAGEYEQAKPIIDTLRRQRDALVSIAFFSVSGYRYAKAVHEAAFFFLAPEDTVWAWERILRVVRPTHTFFVKYELWPAVLSVARTHGAMYLIDAIYQRPNLVRRIYLKWAVQQFDHVFCVEDSDRLALQSQLGVPTGKLSVTGDTKYDRVIARREERREDRAEIDRLLHPFIDGRKVLLLGSSWPADLAIVLEPFKAWATSGRAERSPLLLIAPHDTSAEMIERIETLCKQHDLATARLSTLDDEQAISTQAVIIDRIGLLAELYGLSDAAFVGGAMTYRVHNVLEPASYDLPLAFGPYYNNSREARLLVSRKAACVVHNSLEFGDWLNQLQQESPSTAAIVKSEAGAADRILAHCIA